jgi:hypothetical protein
MFELVFAWLIGAAVSVLFNNCFALLPASLLLLIVAALGEVSRGATIWSTGTAMLLVATFTQLGYFAGSVLRLKVRDRRREKTVIPVTRNSLPGEGTGSRARAYGLSETGSPR